MHTYHGLPCNLFCPRPTHQVCGEAKYTDDINPTADTLHAALVLSTRPHARIASVDVSKALKARAPVNLACTQHALVHLPAQPGGGMW